MKKIYLFALLLFTMSTINFPVRAQTTVPYVSYKNDPTGLRIYTLDNGLKVYLARNNDRPIIQSYIAVKAGATYDPADNTGLAHYLEHMLFKGSSKIGAMNWKKEKPLLDKISDLYEMHKSTKDSKKREEIYHQIDSLSYQASSYVAANEFDKMLTSIGVSATNAFTSNEYTVYESIIPSNALDKWLIAERERFNELVLRLFHTELETVYEEFNRVQDNDQQRAYQAFFRTLFPKHPYGQQTVIGTSDHLKNPSMKAIHNYFKKYYVPNNMAIVLVGDIQDYDKTLEMVKKHFGNMKKAPFQKPIFPKENPIVKQTTAEVYGPTPENIIMGYRSAGIGTKDELYITLISRLLSNSTAGLLDLDLNQQQKVQYAYSAADFFNEYGFHYFAGYPKQGQSLEEVKNLLLAEIEKLKKGDFEDWMLKAIIAQIKTEQIRKFDEATPTAEAFMEAFAAGQDWQRVLDKLDKLSTITKEDVIRFAGQFYKDNNYVVVYKKQGVAKDVVHVSKPPITAIQLNNDAMSEFAQNFDKIEVPDMQPVFVDFKKELNASELSKGVSFRHVENKKNDLFSLSYVFDIGELQQKELPVAIEYMDLLGTEKYSPSELKKEFYKLGVDFSFRNDDYTTILSLSGLYDEEKLNRSIALMEDILDNLKVDKDAYVELVKRMQKNRENQMQSKRGILSTGLFSLAAYGENSKLRNRPSIKELESKDPQYFVDLIKKLKEYKHEFFYYGKHEANVKNILREMHKVKPSLVEYPPVHVYNPITPSGNIYVCDYDMVQSELLLLSKDDSFSQKDIPYIRIFNNYFGEGGLSSIVFQEIREKRALAYAAYASYRIPDAKEKKYGFIFGYIGTQSDKLPIAVDAISDLMNDMPKEQKQFENAKVSALKEVQSERINKDGIYWYYRALLRQGYDYDIRKEIYAAMQTIDLNGLSMFFNTHIKNKKYNYAVIGKSTSIDFDALKKLGEIKQTDVKYIFNEP